jgi:hypothetical protein
MGGGGGEAQRPVCVLVSLKTGARSTRERRVAKTRDSLSPPKHTHLTHPHPFEVLQLITTEHHSDNFGKFLRGLYCSISTFLYALRKHFAR